MPEKNWRGPLDVKSDIQRPVGIKLDTIRGSKFGVRYSFQYLPSSVLKNMKSLLFCFAVVSVFAACSPAAPKTESQTVSNEMSVKNAIPTEPDWAKSANLYELNVRQFSPEGNFAAPIKLEEELATKILHHRSAR